MKIKWKVIQKMINLILIRIKKCRHLTLKGAPSLKIKLNHLKSNNKTLLNTKLQTTLLNTNNARKMKKNSPSEVY